MVLSSFLVSLAELSHIASVASVVICCALMIGFLLRLCGQDLLNGGMAWNDEHGHNFVSKILNRLTPNLTNLRQIESFVAVTKVRNEGTLFCGPLLIYVLRTRRYAK